MRCFRPDSPKGTSKSRKGIMAVSVSIPTPLRALTGQKDTVEVEAKDVHAMLASLEKSFPGIHDRLVDEKGGVRRFVNIYVGGEDIRFLQNQQTPLKAGDEVSIVPAIAGG